MKTDLITVPNIGKSTKQVLMRMGITCVEDLKGKNPEELYLRDCEIKGFKEDKCELYIFRAIVYYAENQKHDSEKLKWWYWKDKKYQNRHNVK